jgi:hypothetical protein
MQPLAAFANETEHESFRDREQTLSQSSAKFRKCFGRRQESLAKDQVVYTTWENMKGQQERLVWFWILGK